MTPRTKNSVRGFTILEALVSLSLFLVVMTVVMNVYTPSRQLYRRGERQTDVQQNGRLAMSEMTRQIRMAGYFPENFTTPLPATLLEKRILVATDTALVIHGDADSTGASHAFLFCLDGSDLRRLRGAADAAGTFSCTGGNVLAQNVTRLQFTYYDADGNPTPDPPTSPFKLDTQDTGGLPDLTDTTQRDRVERVVVALALESEPLVGKTQTFNLTSDVVLRNGS